MSRFQTLVLILLTAVLAACSSPGGGTNEADGGDPTGDAGAPEATAGGGDAGGEDGAAIGDACALVTPEEVEAAVGVEVAETVESEASCSYLDSNNSLLLAFVAITQNAAATFESQRAFEGSEEITGIGDGALWFPGGGMYLLKGDTLLNMTIGGVGSLEGDPAAQRAALEELARAAAARL